MRSEEIGAGARPERDICRSDSSGILHGIQEPGVSLCIWERPPPAGLDKFLARVAASEPFQLEAYDTLDALRLDAMLDGFSWSADPERAQWAADLASLVARFHALRPEPPSRPLHLKLGVIERVDCPVFHTDWVSLRLICTYAGTGTDYVAERSVDRGALCCPLATPAETNAAIVRDPAAIHRMAPFAVGLFKGNAYPGEPGRGIVHRSPSAGRGRSARRIKLIIDSCSPVT